MSVRNGHADSRRRELGARVGPLGLGGGGGGGAVLLRDCACVTPALRRRLGVVAADLSDLSQGSSTWARNERLVWESILRHL